MAKQKNKEPDIKLPSINVSNNRWQYLPPALADVECTNFDCSGNFLTNLAFAPKKITGNLICKNNKKVTGELNPLNQFHLGAGRFDVYEGSEDIEINRPVYVGDSYITDLGTYKDPKIYDCTVESSAAPPISTAVSLSKITKLSPSAKESDVNVWLQKIFIDSGPGMHRVKNMMISFSGIKFIEKEEGVILYVYDDAGSENPVGMFPTSYDQFVGNPTIGIGHLIRPSEREKYRPYLKGGGKKLTLAQAWLLKIDDALGIMNSVKNSFAENAQCTQSMFDAICSWAFNTGAGREYRKHDKKPGPVAAVKKMNEGDYKTAANYMRTYNKNFQKSLNDRREREYKLFIKNGYVE